MKNVSLVNDQVLPMVKPVKAVIESEHNEKPTFSGTEQWKK